MEDIPDDDREGYDEEDGYDRDYEDDEKEEGDRFFGDGLTEKQRDILEMLDQADEVGMAFRINSYVTIYDEQFLLT